MKTRLVYKCPCHFSGCDDHFNLGETTADQQRIWMTYLGPDDLIALSGTIQEMILLQKFSRVYPTGNTMFSEKVGRYVRDRITGWNF